MKILQIGTIDKAGGAAQVSWDLKMELEKRGHFVSMFVSDRVSDDKNVFKIPPTFPKQQIVSRVLANDIDFYRTDYILKTKEFQEADIVNCHNLHCYFFNLDTLRKISEKKPIVWTLHDLWSISSRCAYPSEDSLKNGFFHCGDLNHYPPMEWHNEKYLAWKKSRIYAKTRLNLVTPSLWLKNLVARSVLENKPCQVINNGIDTSIFRQHNKQDCRQELGWPEDKKIILFLASGGNADPRKGWQYTQDLVETITDKQSFLFICVGGKQEDKTRDNLWFIPKSRNRNLLAKYFSASDVFLFPSLADNFPLTVLESMACGLPVVGFDTGGVTEEVEHLKTGYVAKYKNIDDLRSGIEYILHLDTEKLSAMKQQCVERVAANFTVEKMTDQYLSLYESLL
ncbi:MAG: hypothetical protein A2418_00620 [Candidatus Brennerbacteria bacterium RIFOXYC1_FULL_41_11]|uniref:Glycosyltransferase subfamily 4-like N-terminal domain-containing protein n=1 Tax=Candidatus Brennerbacteria bacterium RIFOXYD1_FULL_41_16 TaxID=1797529 RepID=A0A1G1XMC1_9BACT|nr:MAG: Glycosyl transferase, group 1/2 family protein [Parcubacteria group bacterium GW2011_GWB1_41_4]OGY39768.1 MAG: hypothetical protein A2391_03520 [Candidatus Brennerbacteria bacterium RIFOXYB1_FULL_41_13]OGY40386.1 MAG: hypothetical protein A2418_00620 [Candidatus Brennerbacteria bacterium RIFOXYC1_FULL_41_11]OGY40816.1 MAG: hypothetical protein A2570_00155 [Candidatus Brennerbacteria bacterium RIFOXYD1_FULL_41_16]